MLKWRLALLPYLPCWRSWRARKGALPGARLLAGWASGPASAMAALEPWQGFELPGRGAKASCRAQGSASGGAHRWKCQESHLACHELGSGLVKAESAEAGAAGAQLKLQSNFENLRAALLACKEAAELPFMRSLLFSLPANSPPQLHGRNGWLLCICGDLRLKQQGLPSSEGQAYAQSRTQ